MAAPRSIAAKVGWKIAWRGAANTALNAIKGVIGMAFLIGATPVSAQVFDAPILCPEEGECSAPGEALYDLSGFDIPFQVQWPNPPNITRTIHVPGDMSLTVAAAISGAHIIIAAGSHPGITIRQTDQWFDLDDNAVIVGSVTVSRNDGQARTKFSGGEINGRRFQIGGGALDLLVDNVRMNVTGGVYPGLGLYPSDRVAIINTTIRAGNYGLYIDPHAVSNNFIFANLDVVGGLAGNQCSARLMSVQNLVLVDSRIKQDETNGANYVIRLHGDVNNVLIENNQLEPPDSGQNIWLATNIPETQADIFNVYVRNNRTYRTLEGFHAEAQLTATGSVSIYNVWIEDNTLYLAPGVGNDEFLIIDSGSNTPTNTTYRNNVRVDYSSTPIFTGGADH